MTTTRGGRGRGAEAPLYHYAHEDKLFARRLHDALQGRGVRCWLDEKQMLPGDDIYEQVDRGIRLWESSCQWTVVSCRYRSSHPLAEAGDKMIGHLPKNAN